MKPNRSVPEARPLRIAGLGLLLALALAPLAWASGLARLTVRSDDDLGRYLADDLGRGLYVFVDPDREDSLGTADNRPTPPCDAACRAVWPALLTDGAPQAVPAVPADRLGTVSSDGDTQVTFDGWPLYRFAADRSAGSIRGEGIEPPDAQAFGGAWYLIAPDGTLVKPDATGASSGGNAGGGNGSGDGGGNGGYY